MDEIPSDTQKSTNIVSTPAVSKDVVPSHYADIELSHRGGTYDPIQNKRNQVVYSTVISFEVCYITHFTYALGFGNNKQNTISILHEYINTCTCNTFALYIGN